jgi:sugar phosphate isomerase/epimerase
MGLSLGLIGLDYADGPLESAFASAQQRRIRWLELYYAVNFGLLELDSVRRLSKRYQIAVSSVSSLAKLNCDEADLPHHLALVRDSIRCAADLGAQFVTFMFGGSQEVNEDLALARFVRRVAPLAKEAREAGITLLIENVFSRGLPGDLDSAERTARLFAQLDGEPIGLNFDPGNYAIAGEEAFPYAYHVVRPFIQYIHLKDVTRYMPEVHGPMGLRRPLQDHRRGLHVSVPLGRGCLNTDGLLARLRADGYQGVVALEPFAYGADRESWLDHSLAFLRERSMHP